MVTHNFLGLEFVPIDPRNYAQVMEKHVYSYEHLWRVHFLIRDVNTSGYEVVTTTQPDIGVKKISRGKVTTYLNRLYGAKILDNIEVWVAVVKDDIPQCKELVERHLLGQWADKESEAIRCRKLAASMARKGTSGWLDDHPEAHSFMVSQGYIKA